MSQEVFYQKYRPIQIAHVVGQELVTTIIKRSCKKENFHHSYLLSGKFGTGKTSVARILAAILTCENRKEGSSVVCHKCPGCLAAFDRGSQDIQELDAASNSGVENIRRIIDGSRYTPQDLNKRVFIIDEVHRLSAAAMTSLLKTLEEPPPTAVFILCTTEFEKVPPEIRSRCLKLHFKSLSYKLVSSYIGRLFSSKEIEIDASALDCIAKASRGSMRDALEIAQEVMLISNGEKIIESDVTGLVGMAGREELYSIVTSIAEGELLLSFDVLERIFESGISPRTLIDELGDIFRNIMISKVSNKFVEELVSTEQNVILSVKDKYEMNVLASMVAIFEDAQKAVDVNINNRWVLETVVVKIIDSIKKSSN